MLYDTIEEAVMALQAARMDVEADMGAEVVEAGWSDIVWSIAECCTPEVAEELRRREGVSDRFSEVQGS